MPDGNYDPAADLAPVYEDAGKRYGLDPDFLRAQTNVESGGNPYAVSSAGAEGISQFIPSTASREGLRDPYDPREAIPAQAKLMRENANQFGSMPLAVAAYHGGTDPSAWGDKTRGYLDAVNAEYQRLKAARPPPAAPAQAQQKAPSIADQITTARQAGYSDDEIASYLQQSKTWAPKFDAARQAGYLDSDVFQHFGLKVQEGTPLTNKQAVKQLPFAQTEAQAPLPLEQRVAGAEPNTPPTAPPAKDTGWLGAFTAGLGSSIRGGAQTYQALAGGRPAASEPTVKAAEPIEWGDVSNPGLLGRKFLYGIAASAPQIAGFSAGAALAGGPETPIGLAAGAAGAAIAEAATSLGPSFGNELKASPQDPDGAFNRAMKQTGVGAAFTGLGFASFGIAPFEGALKNMVFQAFGVQPAVAVAQKGTENVMEGRPVGEDIYQGVPGAIAMTAAPLLAHAGARRLLGRGAAPEEAAPAAAGVGPPSAAPTTGTPAPEASVAQPRTMEEAALAELDPETHAAAADAHASLAEIAKEEGVEVPPMPKPKRGRKRAPAPEPPTEAAPEQPQIINMQGAGAAIAGNMRDAMWDKLQKGDLTEGGQPSDVLRAAQQNIESGAIKGRTDFDRFVDWWATGGREQKPAEQFGPPTPPWQKPGLNELERAGPPAPPWQRPGLTERERLGPPEAPRQTREEAFQAQREAEQQSLQQAQSFADAGKPMRFRSSVFPDSTYLVSPSVDEGATPGQWRTTTFIGGKPEGHLDFPSATEAFNHVTSRGAEPDVPVPVPPITPLQERHAQVSAAEAERSQAEERGTLPTVEVTPQSRIRTIEQIQAEDGVGPKKAQAIQMQEIAAVGRPITLEEMSARSAGVAAPKPAPRAQTPFEAAPKEPQRLIDFLRSKTVVAPGTLQESVIPGGIKDPGGDLRAILGGSKGRPGLINNASGMSLHDKLIQAWENGYLPEYGEEPPTDDRALLDAIRDDHMGTARYSMHDQDAVEAYQAATEGNREIDRLAAEHGIETRGKTRDQFFDELHDRMSLDERAQEIASQDAAHEAAYREAEQQAKQWVAYHGTPHEFDQFDTSKIGTGEGAQAYGHGLYFAENPGVADSYRSQLSTWTNNVARHIKEITGLDNLDPRPVQQVAMDTTVPVDRAAKMLASRVPELRGFDSPSMLSPKPRLEKLIQAIRDDKNAGNLLTVRLHARPEEMLDWDKPLAEQPPQIRAALAQHGITDPALTGAKAYTKLSDRLGSDVMMGPKDNPALQYGPAHITDEAAASEALRTAGAKGIRYLDQQSRNLQLLSPQETVHGQWLVKQLPNGHVVYRGTDEAAARAAYEKGGTRNVVMFDPRDIEITHRNGEPVAPEAWNAQHFYGISQARTLEDLEREHAEEAQPHPATPAPGERAAGEPEPGPAGADQGAVPEGGGPRRGGAGDADRGAAAHDQATDLLGKPVAEPRARTQPEPTIRNDARQDAMPGMEQSAVQAQAARDAQSRGALQAEAPQKPADEGLFAPDTSGQGVLYSGPSAIFDPAAWRRAFGAGPPLAPHEVLADKEGMARAAAEIKAGFAPTSLRGAKPMEYAIRRHTSETAQAHDIDVAALEKVRAATDRLSQQDQIEFSHRMEISQAQPTPELQAVADALRSVIDGWARKVQGLGKGYLANAIENYMGHIWGNYREWSQGNALPGRTHAQMQGAATAANVRKQPLQGSGNFLKQRSFPTQLEGINAGLIPVTYNPVDLQLIKAHEMRKFYFGSVLADQIKSSGLARWVSDSDAREASDRGEVPLDDKIFQPKLYGVTPIGPVEPGKWYAPESAARVFNNYMSQGWANRSTIYDALRQSNNALNGLQLGIGGFHAAFVTNDVATSKVALAIQQIARGDLGRGAANLLFGTPVLGHAAAVTDSLRKGSQVRREWLDPGSGSPEVQRVVNAIKAGGYRMTMPDFFQSSTSGTFFKNWNDLKNPASVWQQSRQMFRDAPTVYQKAIMTPIRIAARTLDTVMQPLMGVMVPRAKAGVMYDLAADWLRRNPNASDHDLSAAMTQFQDSVDNRLGQLNYENLFWNKTLKDIAFVTTRSVGWNLGTLREIGGAVPDSGKFLSDFSRGRFPEMTTRMAYVLAMPAVTGMLGAVMTYLATGQGPQSALDLFYPPTGGETQQGVPDRRSIPGYIKDVVAYAHDPIQTLLNKSSPMIEAMTEIRNNRDYYGGIIWDPERDRGPAQAYGDFLINQVTPFSVRSMGRLRGEGAPALDQSLGFFGFQPAPASITNPERAQKFERREQTKAYKAREKEVSKGLSMHIFNTPSGAP